MTRKNLTEAQPAPASSPGVISLHELYTLAEAKARLGWTESGLRAAKRRGLKLLRCGKRRYLLGKAIVEFLEHLAASGTAQS